MQYWLKMSLFPKSIKVANWPKSLKHPERPHCIDPVSRERVADMTLGSEKKEDGLTKRENKQIEESYKRGTDENPLGVEEYRNSWDN